MDKLALAKLRGKIENGDLLLKRIELLEGIKKKLMVEDGLLTIEILESGYSRKLDEGTDKHHVFAKYKGFVLDGVNTELSDLEAEFDEL